MNLDILFVGKLFPREIESEIKCKMKTGMQDAANALQWHIIDGLDENDCGTVKILDYLPIDSYPNGYVDKRIDEYVFQHSKKYISNDKIVGCTNLSLIKQFVNILPFRKEVKKWVVKKDRRQKVFISYTASSMFLQLAKYAKCLDNNITTACIIADIPEFICVTELNGLYKVFNDYETRKSDSLYKYIDRFVLLTKQMAERLNIRVPFTIVEGIATNEDVVCDETLVEQYKEEKYILYSGTLNYKFGIRNLVEAFSQIPDQDVRLLICGFGEAEELIREKQETDSRIVYMGKVDRKTVLTLQKGATVLVNPRQNNEEFTKYSFPSKNLEYLSSGVPVIAYKLDGIPDEYDDYMIYVQDNTIEALRNQIQRVCRMSNAERMAIGEKARKYVLEKKNSVTQTKKIIDLLIK